MSLTLDECASLSLKQGLIALDKNSSGRSACISDEPGGASGRCYFK